MEELTRKPYVGPRPFERSEIDRLRFFGRQREIGQVVSLVLSHPLVLVYAQSGAGKTSLFDAGVVPDLAGRGVLVLPAARVQTKFRADLKAADVRNVYMLATLLRIDPKADAEQYLDVTLAEFLSGYYEKHRGDGDIALAESTSRPMLLVFDQFEELFSFQKVYELFPDSWQAQRRDFFEQVAAALEELRQLRVVFVIREEYLAQLEQYAALLPEGWRVGVHLERLREKAALEAIRRPLEKTKRSFRDGVAEQLADALLTERMDFGYAEPFEYRGEFVEPVVLQVVCENIWRRLGPKTRLISIDHLRLEDLDAVLADYYAGAVKDAVEKHNVDEGALRAFVENSLITPADTRGLEHRGPKSTKGIPNPALDVLEDRHLIRSEWRAGARFYELTHDRFIKPIKGSNQSYRADVQAGREMEKETQANRAAALAEQAFFAREYRAAIEGFDRARQLYEELGDAWSAVNMQVDMAIASKELADAAGLKRHAKEALKGAGRIEYRWAECHAHFLIGVAHRLSGSRGSKGRARRELTESVDCYRKLGDAESLMRQLLDTEDEYAAMGLDEEAEQALREAIEVSADIPDDEVAYNTLLNVAEDRGDVDEYEKAIRLCTAAIPRSPTGRAALARNRRAALYWHLGEHDAALEDLSRLLDDDRDDTEARALRGQVLAEQHRFEEALIDLEAVDGSSYVNSDPERKASVLTATGLALASAGRKKEALEQFEAAFRLEGLDDENGEPYYRRAEAYETLGEAKLAVEDYRAALDRVLLSWQEAIAKERIAAES